MLDVGGGVGHLAQFFLERRCGVVSTDTRPANVERMREVYPSLEGRIDVDRHDLVAFGRSLLSSAMAR